MRLAILVLAALSASSCATIISGSTQKLALTSDPPGADVLVEPGWYVVKTPIVLDVDRKDAPLRLTFTMEHYQPLQAQVEQSGNPWTLVNIPLGVIWIGFDLSSGAAFALSPDAIHAILVKEP
jgi:hypothetical protein